MLRLVARMIKTRSELTELQWEVTQNKGTERPYSSSFVSNKRKGYYHCIVCDHALFSSDSKYDSRTGWPSFFMPISRSSLKESTDNSHGMVRTEVHCSSCSAHLGHVFRDGPRPTGLRYCINGVALEFKDK